MTATFAPPAPIAPAEPSDAPKAVIDRVSLILDAFEGPGRLTLAQIVRRTGLPRSSAHRMLESLVQLRWLRRDGRDYELGIRLVELGSLAMHQDRLHNAALPKLRELHAATGLVVHLAILDGPDVFFIEKIGNRMASAIPTRVGGRQPAHCTALGKALLAYVDPAELDEICAGPLAHRTRYSIATGTQLRAELGRIRERGVAVDREEAMAGVGCLAAPIGNPGEAVAALSVCGPAGQMTFDQRLASPVRMTALAIWRAMEARIGRVAPTLQKMRPLSASPLAHGPSRELAGRRPA
ncbi:IclR family transcriptional regulator [Mycobacterium koreense]|uniref:IclR family transcriptional regulator n=1 Tax=Mycolicibacillus koreensis TaxID=1069220 RepID=A0A7I7SIR1_9MYCO|nr:IclR family transcriptional regulator [Mycolicibacillus koreensis]MCV7250523.1 IclR family transcriptional regulator [Mycolicibacillus koreensis]ODR04819.1 IclR family transcriptional regulator [Mycolicibacillus koreensis]OSC32769.1 IclR family transcriptional regulator [Mycolicibacillus koreensis]BBY56390.1 transcriptional regulator [Mycolicibacillus koreensis]